MGIKLFAQGVLVVGLSDITTDQGLASPARACGLQEGDVITHINDAQVSSIEEVQTILQDLEGQEMELTVLRDEESQEVTTRAAQCSTGGACKLGAWIRDSMAGIGTLTFVDPETGLFGTLGHGINDVDTAVLMKLQSGAITPASVAGVVKGVNGRPGELRGAFSSSQDLGTLYANTESGVFGHLQDPGTFTGTPVPVATAEEVHTGQATILANVAGTEVEEYTVEILKVYSNTSDTRDLMLRVTDPRLLEKTGGIVQGMSGSPILQDGKLVGAVTHVLIDHADRGYGILAQNMLDQAAQAQNT
ncbi:MAG: SpoIVB peptidase [Evtepia gabavorous]